MSLRISTCSAGMPCSSWEASARLASGRRKWHLRWLACGCVQRRLPTTYRLAPCGLPSPPRSRVQKAFHGHPVGCGSLMFNASDEKQVIKMSTDLLKNLFDIGKPRTLGARNDDLTVPPFIPVLVTANSNSGQGWVGKRAEFDRPCQRRTITYVIRSPLLNPTWLHNEMADSLTDCDPADERAKDIMRHSAFALRDSPPEHPTGMSLSSIMCPPRRS
mmetsp:Transcript_78343/g.242919  ORF Transcript_78343/g.242919 Transcript_78343/m.242919 type:complete len:217 (+) Transcript_78343:1528-2178(+)